MDIKHNMVPKTASEYDRECEFCGEEFEILNRFLIHSDSGFNNVELRICEVCCLEFREALLQYTCVTPRK